jgi:Holliday junction DNA helicase RuvA
MIHFLEGKIEVKEPNLLVLNVNNLGFECTITLYTYEKLPPKGSLCRIHTYMHVREDILQLYGFIEPKERKMFDKLISLSGIGPKQAINILSGIRYDQMMEYIIQGDVAAVKRAPGVGDKTARRIILELKDKISDEEVTFIAGASAHTKLSNHIKDAVLALESLGYKKTHVQSILDKNIKKDEDLTTEEIIRVFLQMQNK